MRDNVLMTFVSINLRHGPINQLLLGGIDQEQAGPLDLGRATCLALFQYLREMTGSSST